MEQFVGHGYLCLTSGCAIQWHRWTIGAIAIYAVWANYRYNLNVVVGDLELTDSTLVNCFFVALRWSKVLFWLTIFKYDDILDWTIFQQYLNIILFQIELFYLGTGWLVFPGEVLLAQLCITEATPRKSSIKYINVTINIIIIMQRNIVKMITVSNGRLKLPELRVICLKCNF